MHRVGLALVALALAAPSAFADHHHRHHDDTSAPPTPPPQPTPAPTPTPQPEPPPPPSDTESPWAKGVTDEQKQAANNLLGEGNDLFVQNKYKEALAKYTDAIAVWDHPAIRFNMVRALIALDRPLDAYDNLQKALAYGKAPLEDQVYSEALNYQTLLEGQIANLQVSCKQAGVDVSVDGQPFLSCPGAKSERVLPGHHVVVGKKQGYLTYTNDAVLLAKVDQPIDVKLQSVQEAAVTRTRWAVWKPWAVAGAGALVAGLGGLVDWGATTDLSNFNDLVQRDCMDSGCPAGPGSPSLSTQDRALLENKIAIGMMAVGGAAVATGIVLVIMNRPHTYVPEQSTVVTPMVTPGGGAGASITLRY